MDNLVSPERLIPARAKAPQHNWRVPYSITEGATWQPKVDLLKNFLEGRELEAGLEIIHQLETAFVEGHNSLIWGDLKEKVVLAGHCSSTARNALRKLERHRITTAEAKWTGGGGRWAISWSGFAGLHKKYMQVGKKFQKELDKRKEEDAQGKLSQRKP